MKENKYYSPVSFWLPIAYVLALGLFFTEDSRYTKVLHKDQTDEWKGMIFNIMWFVWVKKLEQEVTFTADILWLV